MFWKKFIALVNRVENIPAVINVRSSQVLLQKETYWKTYWFKCERNFHGRNDSEKILCPTCTTEMKGHRFTPRDNWKNFGSRKLCVLGKEGIL